LRRPLWESLVSLESRAGRGLLPVFHWWLESLAHDVLGEVQGARPTLADRYRAHVEIPCTRAEDLPVLAPATRAVPRLAKVRYDALYKHMKAHLPELRDLGEDFPSPERFEQYGFQWLDFVWLGGGRMLLLHGPGQGGVHAFWLGALGFEKSAHFSADAVPAHLVKVEGDKVLFVVSRSGKTLVHEMLWWGP
jgi:hypothetical protein